MKNTGRILALAALLGANANAASFLAIGDNAELFLTGSAAIRFDDNIYLDSVNEQDDVIWSFTPGIDIVFGQGAATQGNIYYREEILRYSDADNQDTSLSNIGFTTKYDGGKSKFDFAFTFAELSQNDNDVRAAGDLVDRDVTHFHARPEFGITQKSSLSIGVAYDRMDFKPANYSDRNVWSVPLDYYFEYSPKLDLSVGYRHRETDLSRGGRDSKDNLFSIGARGEFTPKLNGQVRVGLNNRKFDTGGDDDLLGVDASLAYQLSSRTVYHFNVSNDFGADSVGGSTKEFMIGLQGHSEITPQLSVNGGLSFRAIGYSNRDDDFLEGNLGMSYTVNAYVRLSAYYTYRDNDSTLNSSNFANNVFSFAANLRY